MAKFKNYENISIQKKVKKFIDGILPGAVFRYNDISTKKEEVAGILKALSRLTKKENIKRLRKGIYYKPKQSVFGEIKPDENEIINILTINDKTIIGYKTGISEYNRLGLTAQVPNAITLKAKGNKRRAKISNLGIKYQTLNHNIKKNDIEKLRILDALKDITKIPDSDINNVMLRLISLIKKMDLKEKYRLLFLSRRYNPRTRALLGAFFELNDDIALSNVLQRTLNPITEYKIGIDSNILPNKTNWKIK